MRSTDMTGRRLGALLVIRRTNESDHADGWLVRCDCGAETVIQRHQIRRVRSCGCLRNEAQVAAARTHGMGHTPTWSSWISMKQRCTREKDPSWPRYGGRGIRVCQRWLDSFEAFFADMGERPSVDHSIDRMDVNGHYEPGNCRWATRTKQGRNKRNNRRFAYAGESLTLAEWGARIGVSRRTMASRLHRGWPLGRTLTTPLLDPVA